MSTAPQQNDPTEARREEGFALTAGELESFEKNGYIGPFPLLAPLPCEQLAETVVRKASLHPELKMQSLRHRIDSAVHAYAYRVLGRPVHGERPGDQPRYWYKSAHLLVPEIEELALRSEIIDRMKSILGPDLLLWGAQLVAKRGGEHHRWHEDVEHVAWAGATAWIGLTNVSRDSTMKLIPGSHRFGITPQEIAGRLGGRLASDSDMLLLAKTITPAAQIVELDLRPGEFFIFSGRAWHASKNSTGRGRVAMICQFCPPSERVRVPCSYEVPTPWHPRRPWVMLASGEDRFHVNRVTRRHHG